MMRKKLISLFVVLAMCLSVMPNLALAVTDEHDDGLFRGTVDLSEVDLDDALHFIVRHWHAIEEDGTIEEDENLDEYSVVVEGYIVPNEDSADKYDYYAKAYPGTDQGDNLEQFVKLETGVSGENDSDYIGNVGGITDGKWSQAKPGTIDLLVNTYKDQNEEYESFAGFSISGGQSAVEFDETSYNYLRVTYDKNVHLSKAHVFYINERVRNDGAEKIGSDMDYPEYVDAVVDTESGVKYYNNNDGLYTDKTAIAHEDGRTFDVDLQAWFNGIKPANVGLILDASGSMAYTLNTEDDPDEQITVIDEDGNLLNSDKMTEEMAEKIKDRQVEVPAEGETTITLKWENFLSKDEVKCFLNPRDTDNSPLGVSGYKYFVYDDKDTAKEHVPLGYWDGTIKNGAAVSGNTVIGAVGNTEFEDKAGWYYVNFSDNLKNYVFNEKFQTGKVLWGVLANTMNYNVEGTTKTGNDPELSYTYVCEAEELKSTTGTKFFIGADGKLCALFASAGDENNDFRKGVSYVYETEDSSYLKKEALQRALGTFTTKLAAGSPLSKVSAVRFSVAKDKMEAYDEEGNAENVYPMFVMLDWIHNSIAAANMLSNKYGEDENGNKDYVGGTIKGTSWPYYSASTGDELKYTLPQYNYALTGGTNTAQGLKTFLNLLDGNDYADDTDKKYIIIFTDGVDTEFQNKLKEAMSGTEIEIDIENLELEAYTEAQKLKEEGYTILCVLLSTGTVREDAEDSQYENTVRFLKTIAGSEEAEGKLYDPDKSAEENKGANVFASDDADELTEMFSQEILGDILEGLDGYTIKDYIDPRFDIVDADGNVWYLNADHKVVVNGTEKSLPAEITLNSNPIYDGREASLNYDGDKDMYYLVWENQSVDCNVSDSDKLLSWDARVTLRAKEDFIGGNTILVGGNDAAQNYVYEEGDDDASSGIDRYDADKPSKGFPRVVVNVSAPEPAPVPVDDTLFMGENLSVALKRELERVVDNWEDGTSEPDGATQLYYDYLSRYVKIDDNYESLDALITAIANAGKDGLTIPYYYLPNEDETNQTGTNAHKSDLIGNLTYKFIDQAPDAADGDGEDGTTKNTNARSHTLIITYEPLADNDRKIATLVEDDDYPWNSTYKPVEGTPVGDKAGEDNLFATIVSGDIKFDVIFNAEVIEYLNENYKDETITYTAKLMRDGKEFGTYAAAYTPSGSDEGEQTVNGTLTFNTDNGFNAAYGLPLGTYTLVADNITAPEVLKFKDITIHTDDVAQHFGEIENADSLVAPVVNNGIILGTKTDDTTDDRAYIDYRYGYATAAVELGEIPPVTPSPTPTPTPSTGGGGGGTSTPKQKLHYETNGGNDISDETYPRNKTVDIDKKPQREGYIFDGWYSDPELTERVSSVVMSTDQTVYAKWIAEPADEPSDEPAETPKPIVSSDVPDMLNGDDHYAYIIGYPEGDVRPAGNITRAEVATIFFRMLKDDVRAQYWSSENSYSDVAVEAWYDNAVSTMSNMGIVSGYVDGTFKPDAHITRAEFAAIAARFDSSQYTGEDYFSDIAGHWASDAINRAVQRVWISGYNDGTFKPDQTITRAEAMTLVNSVLNRRPESPEALDDGMIVWPDNSDTSAWYYLAVQEATNSHDHDKEDSSEAYERWTGMQPVRDWVKFERIWSDAYSAENPGDVVK